MAEKPFGLLELGSNSLKLYLVELAGNKKFSVKTQKFPWRVGYHFFARGHLGEESIQELIATIRGVEAVSGGVPLRSMLAVATGVFRELPDIAGLAVRVQNEAGVRVRVISGEDEARLMAKGFPVDRRGSHLLCDVGGATTEWAWLVDGADRGWGSLPLGAIRNAYKLRQLKRDARIYLRESQHFCDAAISTLPLDCPTQVMGTGGTAKAAADISEKNLLPISELREMIDRTIAEGPPARLRPERQAVFLPGLVILERLCTRAGSEALEHAQTSVRDGMAQRLVQVLTSHRREDLHSTLLLHRKKSR